MQLNMVRERRWDPCVAHRGADHVHSFAREYFGRSDRRVLFLAGAGFDPRSTTFAKYVAIAMPNLRAIFIKENRLTSDLKLQDLAKANTNYLENAFPEHKVISLDIFDRGDGAVTGGRNAVMKLNQEVYDGITDMIIDISALSIGTSFPIIRYFVERVEQSLGPRNVHIFVAHDPGLDANIRSSASDAPGYIHGFKGGSTLDTSSSAARLWLPQLAAGQKWELELLLNFVRPQDVCPVLPFPAANPRLGDILAEEYLEELENTWEVDSRNIVYADEADPLDLYRTILNLDDLRKPVFAETGGSLIVLSPLRSKVMALGSLMAALERDLPVAHLERLGYEFHEADSNSAPIAELIHIWLEGNAYPTPRPALLARGNE